MEKPARDWRGQKYSAGYSFVEITIAILVAALLIGAIVSAKDLVRASQIRSVIAQVEGFREAVTTFILQYRALPGDMNTATQFWPNQTANGDGDGIINYVVGVNEDLRAWQQLGLANLIPGDYTGILAPGNILLSDVNIPAGAIDKTGYRLVQPTYSVYGKRGNAIILGLSGFQFISGAMFTSQEAWQIDNKVDDGRAHTGMVYSINGWQYYGNVNDPENPQMNGCVDGPITSTSVNYTYNSTQQICAVHFWID